MNLPKLNPNTPTLMDGEVRLFKRKRSSVWQVVFTMDGRQVRVSTKKRILKDALEAALLICLNRNEVLRPHWPTRAPWFCKERLLIDYRGRNSTETSLKPNLKQLFRW
jgi:hypothetical protein